jgi:hypothetical protein
MSKLFAAALGVVLLVGVGCQNDRNTDTTTRSDEMRSTDGTTRTTVRTERTDTMRGADDCSHCPGVQTANADGTCPMCGAKVK